MSDYVSIPEMLLLVVLLSAFGILFLVMRKVVEKVDLFRGKRATVAAFLISCTAIAGTAAMLLAPNSAAESEHMRNVAVNYSLLPYVALAGAVILLELLVIAVRTSPDAGGEVPSKKPVHPSVKPKSSGRPKKEKPAKGQSKEVAKAAGEMTKKGIRRDRPEEVTLGRLCEDFLKTWNPAAKEATMDLYKSTVERLLKHFGAGYLIGSIGPRQADSFLASQTHYINKPTKELSDWTRVQITRHCMSILGVAVRWQWIALNPFADVRMPTPGTKRWHRLAVTEYRRLLEVAPTPRWKVFYAIVFTSGARFGELFNLTWADIDFERGRMIIKNREGSDIMPSFSIKDKDERFVQLPTETLDLLTQYQQQAPEGVPYILLTQERYERVLKRWRNYRKQGRSWRNRYMVNNVGRDFKSHAKRAGLRFTASFTIHTFRKTCAQNWADHLPANVVKFYLGHSNISTTNKFYSIVDESHTSRTTKVMDELLNAKTENHLDTGWTLEAKSKRKSETKEEAAKAASTVNPSRNSTYDASDKWAIQDLNL